MANTVQADGVGRQVPKKERVTTYKGHVLAERGDYVVTFASGAIAITLTPTQYAAIFTP